MIKLSMSFQLSAPFCIISVAAVMGLRQQEMALKHIPRCQGPGSHINHWLKYLVCVRYHLML